MKAKTTPTTATAAMPSATNSDIEMTEVSDMACSFRCSFACAGRQCHVEGQYSQHDQQGNPGELVQGRRSCQVFCPFSPAAGCANRQIGFVRLQDVDAELEFHRSSFKCMQSRFSGLQGHAPALDGQS